MLEAKSVSVAQRLADCSVTLVTGQITAICGPNGAGKSTLLEVLAGLLTPLSGEVRLDGRALADLTRRERARAIGYLPQGGELAWNISVRTLASLGRLPHSTGDKANRLATDAALEAMALTELADRPVSELSGGEQARAMLARVLAGEPSWILADEPLASLDLAYQDMQMRHFRALAQAGRAVVLVLHDLSAAINHADRVIVLSKGEVVEAGNPEQSLAPSVIKAVWGVDAEWLGEPGKRALVLGG